jgi:hypothetical protein
VEVVAANVLLGAKGIHANEAEPRSGDASTDDVSAPGYPGGPY